MKVVVLWSSPNVDGLTAASANAMIRGLEAEGVEIDEIHLNRKNVKSCMGCGNGWGKCREGACVIPDDLMDIYQRMVKADGIVWVSAVYWSGMTEAMKAFVDRLRRMDAIQNHFLRDKRCVLIACAGGTGRGTIECLTDMERALTHMGMRAYDRIPVVRFNAPYMLPAIEAAGHRYAFCLEKGFDMYY